MHPNVNNQFLPLEVFVREKNCCLYYLVFPSFCFISWFLFVMYFCEFTIFSWKKINRLEIVLITSYTILLYGFQNDILAFIKTTSFPETPFVLLWTILHLSNLVCFLRDQFPPLKAYLIFKYLPWLLCMFIIKHCTWVLN